MNSASPVLFLLNPLQILIPSNRNLFSATVLDGSFMTEMVFCELAYWGSTEFEYYTNSAIASILVYFFDLHVRAFTATYIVSQSSTTSSPVSPLSTSLSPSPGSSATLSQILPTNNASSSSKSDLSTGGKAGIGVGASLGFLILVGLLVFLAGFLNRRSCRKEGISGWDKPELAGDSTKKMGNFHEADKNAVYAVPDTGQAVEMGEE